MKASIFPVSGALCRAPFSTRYRCWRVTPLSSAHAVSVVRASASAARNRALRDIPFARTVMVPATVTFGDGDSMSSTMTFGQGPHHYVFVTNGWLLTVAIDEAWGRNLRSAKRAYEERHDTRLTYKVIGERVAKSAGRDKPFGHSAVLNWFENGQEPEAFAIVRAIATVLETEVATLLTHVPRGETPSPATGEVDSLTPVGSKTRTKVNQSQVPVGRGTPRPDPRVSTEKPAPKKRRIV